MRFLLGHPIQSLRNSFLYCVIYCVHIALYVCRAHLFPALHIHLWILFSPGIHLLLAISPLPHHPHDPALPPVVHVSPVRQLRHQLPGVAHGQLAVSGGGVRHCGGRGDAQGPPLQVDAPADATSGAQGDEAGWRGVGRRLGGGGGPGGLGGLGGRFGGNWEKRKSIWELFFF